MEKTNMEKLYVTLTGVEYYYGSDFLEKGTKVTLKKEPDNKYDKEAIQVTVEGLGKIGYIANSPYTVIGECISAGRLYDRMEDTATAKVALITQRGIVCKIHRK